MKDQTFNKSFLGKGHSNPELKMFEEYEKSVKDHYFDKMESKVLQMSEKFDEYAGIMS